MIKKRATNDEERQERRRDIINAARELFGQKEYKSIKITDIAQKVGIAKGTVFIYFKTKEQIFLEVAIEEYKKWFDGMNDYLQQKNKSKSKREIEEIIGYIEHSFETNSTLFRLISILHVILEKNITFEDAVKFKCFLHENILQIGSLLEKSYGFLGKGQGADILLRIHGFIVGFQSMTEVSPAVREAIDKNPELKMFNVNFKDIFTDTLKVYLKGLSE